MIQNLIRVAAWLAFAAVIFVTLSPIGLRPVSPASVNVERLLAYLVIGGLFGAGYPRRLPLVVGLIILAAGGLEAAQNLVPGRHGRIDDFFYKGAGAAIGAIVAGGLMAVVSRRLR